MTNIPGIFQPPDTSDCKEIKLTSFSLRTFTVPAHHVYGRCRPVTDYEKVSLIADGNYSTVYKARDKTSGEIVALKYLRMPRNADMMPQNYLRELSALKLMKHDNIANLLTVAVGKNIESTYLILDYCEYTLSKVVDRVDQRLLRHPQIKHIVGKVLYALDYIHRHGIFHRDLTPMNIMFTPEGVLKIIDFGISRKMSSGAITPHPGVRWYKAPEILFGAANYTPAIDIWAVGCIFAELIRVKILFHGSCDAEVLKMILNFLGTPTESLWPGFSSLPIPRSCRLRFQPYNRIRSTFQSENSTTISLLQKMLLYNPSARPTPEQCLEHQYFADYPYACSTEELLPTLMSSIRR